MHWNPRTSRRFWIQSSNPRWKCLWPSVTELDLGVPMACQVGSAIVLPKPRTTPRITLKPILQTLATRVWVIWRYHWMGLMVPIYFTKSNHIGTIKSVQGDFSVYFKLLFFCSTSGTGFDKLIPPVLGPLFSGMPHPQALSNEVNIIWSPEALQEVSEFICLEGTLCHSILK